LKALSTYFPYTSNCFWGSITSIFGNHVFSSVYHSKKSFAITSATHIIKYFNMSLQNWASTTAMAGRKQKWLKTTCYWFDIQMIRGGIETKHKDIKDATEKKETIKQEYEDFLEDYECIVFGH
jgi:hypothetical protein